MLYLVNYYKMKTAKWKVLFDLNLTFENIRNLNFILRKLYIFIQWFHLWIYVFLCEKINQK